MNANWKIYRLGQITDWFSGGTPRKNIDRYWNGDIPWISASSMSNNRIYTSDLKITEEGLQSGSKLANKDDILLLVRGSILHQKIPVGIVMNEVSYNQDVKRIKVKDNLNPWFLLYWFMGNEKTLLQKVDVTGIGAGKFDTAFLQNYPISLPSLKEQKIIVDIVKSLDDKIHLNNQINQTLESIAQAIFKSWFIDFEPVHAKIAAKQEGKDPELAAMCAISGKSETELEQMTKDDLAELQATAALFPDELVESELGEVPRGWEVTLLKDVVTELRRGISPKYTEDLNSVIVINQKCIRNHTINFFLARKHDNLKRKIDGRELQIGDVLVNSTGVGTLGRIAPVRYLDSITVVDSHVTVVRANDKKISRAYLQGLLLENEKFIEASGAGTTGQTELRKEVVQDIKFPNPTVALHQQFDSIICKINQKIANLEKMNICLSHVRDTLLPKLLSGEVDVSDLHGEGV